MGSDVARGIFIDTAFGCFRLRIELTDADGEPLRNGMYVTGG